MHKQVSSSLSPGLDLAVDSVNSFSDIETKQEIGNTKRTLKELATPNETNNHSTFSI